MCNLITRLIVITKHTLNFHWTSQMITRIYFRKRKIILGLIHHPHLHCHRLLYARINEYNIKMHGSHNQFNIRVYYTYNIQYYMLCEWCVCVCVCAVQYMYDHLCRLDVGQMEMNSARKLTGEFFIVSGVLWFFVVV